MFSFAEKVRAARSYLSAGTKIALVMLGIGCGLFLFAANCAAADNIGEAMEKQDDLEARLNRALGNEQVESPTRSVEELASELRKTLTRAAQEVNPMATDDVETAQAEALRLMDELLEQLQQESEGNPDADSASSSTVGGVTPKPAAGDGGEGTSQSSPRDSSPDSHGITTAEIAQQRRQLASSVWGHLPDRVRERLQGSYREKYLPAYEDLVEGYYRALAEESVRDNPSRQQPTGSSESDPTGERP